MRLSVYYKHLIVAYACNHIYNQNSIYKPPRLEEIINTITDIQG